MTKITKGLSLIICCMIMALNFYACGDVKFSSKVKSFDYSDTKYTIPCLTAGCEFSSSDENVFIIDNGKIKTTGGGLATLTATKGSKSSSMTIIVTNILNDRANLRFTTNSASRLDTKIGTNTIVTIAVNISILNVGEQNFTLFDTDSYNGFSIYFNNSNYDSLCCRASNDESNSKNVENLVITPNSQVDILVLFPYDELPQKLTLEKKYFEVEFASGKIGATKLS